MTPQPTWHTQINANQEAQHPSLPPRPQQLSNTITPQPVLDTPAAAAAHPPTNWPFITRRGHVLYEGNQPFRFISFNIPSLLLLEDRPDTDGWIPPDPYEQHDALLSIAHLGGRVTRSYTLGIGENYHITGIATFNERAFVAMDHALAIAQQVRVRVVIPFINNHWGGDDGGTSDPSICTFGNYAQLAKMRNKRPSQFWTDPQLIDDFQHIISYVLNRVNTVNGIRYGDDPTVLAWQLGNELGGWKGNDPPAAWTLAMTAHIRSLAPNTLVMDGSIGGLKSKEKLCRETLTSPHGPDIFVNHYYHGGDDVKRLSKDADHIAGKHGKVFIVGEFGFAGTNVYGQMYDSIIRNTLVSGSLMWSLRYHSMFGGFYVHSEEGGKYWSYHNPGFPTGTHGFCGEEIDVMPQIRHYALSIQNLDPRATPYPVPHPPPQLLPDIAPNWIRFRGSVSAASYLVWRGTQQQGGGGVTWEPQPIGINVMDNKCSGSTLWQDKDAKPGVPYFYAVQAVGVGGAMSAWSDPVGPVWAGC
ncbi:glycoside hydrolase superfamily [Powellomyces hirtus]|nr:glycoside hydrolase superfamily [Powellomyces hirtus]